MILREASVPLYTGTSSARGFIQLGENFVYGYLINQNDADPHFLSRILFSDESLFCREGCSNYPNLHIWA
jgi:hypothetical protein